MAHRLPERVLTALFDASTGLRVRRSGYERDAQVESGTAARDLRIMVAAGLLDASGETRARRYGATAELRAVRDRVADGRPTIVDPFGGDPPAPTTTTRSVTTTNG